MARSPTHAETAQRVLDTPGLLQRLAISCVRQSPALGKLAEPEQLDAFNEICGLLRAELERIAKAGPHFPEPK
jgi:hypothetical protein